MGSNGFTAVAVLSTDRSGKVVPWILAYPTANSIKAAKSELKSQGKTAKMFGLLSSGEWQSVYADKDGTNHDIVTATVDQFMEEPYASWLSKQSRHW